MGDLFKVAGVGGLVDTFLGDATDGFQTGFVFELIDIRKSEPIKAFALVVNPTRYEISEPFQAELTPAEDGTVIAEETGIVIREIVLEGTFGLKSRRSNNPFSNKKSKDSSFGLAQLDPLRKSANDEKSGTTWFKELRDMFRAYSSMKKDAGMSPFIQLVFHSLKDDDHFLVVPREFISPRDSRTNRMHRIFRIRLTAIDGPKFSAKKPKDKKKGFFDKVNDLSKALNDARAAFADATADLAKIRRKIGNINALMIQAASVITAMGNFVRGLRSTFVVTPIHTVTQVAAAFERAADDLEAISSPDPDVFPEDRDFVIAMRSLSQAFDQMAQYPEVFESSSSLTVARGSGAGTSSRGSIKGSFSGDLRLTQSDIDDQTAGASVGTRTRVTQGSARDGGLDLGNFRGIIEWIVKRTDSMQSIANETGAQQEAIIILNDLRYPYLSEGGGPGIAKPGDKILIPTSEGRAEEGAPSAPSPSASYYTAEDVIYGADLAIDQERLDRDDVMEILVDRAHGYEDAQLVRGVPNAVQGITIIINTELGATSIVPDVGVRRPIGSKGTMEHTLMSAIRLREGILSDDRIEGIESISTVLDGDTLTQEIVPILITGRPVTLAVPFGRASGTGSTRVR